MIKRILVIMLIINIFGISNIVFAKYVINKEIVVAEVDITERKRYSVKILYKDIDTNKTKYTYIKRYYEGDAYEMECLEFEGYTYQYTDGNMTGIVDGDITIYRYYKRNT